LICDAQVSIKDITFSLVRNMAVGLVRASWQLMGAGAMGWARQAGRQARLGEVIQAAHKLINVKFNQ